MSKKYLEKKLKISFDFDGTLEHEAVQKVASDLITAGYNVCILTTRYSDPKKYHFPVPHADLYGVAESLGITEINFTEFEWKATKIDSLGIHIHIDDNIREEVYPINEQCKATAISYCSWDNAWTKELYAEIKRIEETDDKLRTRQELSQQTTKGFRRPRQSTQKRRTEPSRKPMDQNGNQTGSK